MEADKTLNCMGLIDPMPIVYISKKMRELKPGEILQVTADDKGITQDVPAWCRLTGQEYLGVEEANLGIKLFVKRIVQTKKST